MFESETLLISGHSKCHRNIPIASHKWMFGYSNVRIRSIACHMATASTVVAPVQYEVLTRVIEWPQKTLHSKWRSMTACAIIFVQLKAPTRVSRLMRFQCMRTWSQTGFKPSWETYPLNVKWCLLMNFIVAHKWILYIEYKPVSND